MTTVRELIDSEATIGLVLMGGVATDRVVTQVVVAESLASVGDATAGVVVVATPGATRGRDPYEFDVAVRRASSRGAAAIVLMERQVVSATMTHLAERGDLALLACSPGASIAEVVLTIDHFLQGDLVAVLVRAEAALESLREMESPRSLDDILDVFSMAVGVQIRLADDDGIAAEPVIVQGQIRFRLAAADVADRASRLVLPTLAGYVARWQEQRDTEDTAPDLARADALAELVLRESNAVPPGHADRLRVTGLVLESTHVVVAFATAAVPATSAHELVEMRTRRDRLRFVLTANLPQAAPWSVTVVEDDVLLVRSGTVGELPTPRSVADEIGPLLARAREDDERAVFVGVGSAQQGLGGLRVSATEARIAAADLAASGRDWAIAIVDSSGVSRILSEIAGSWMGRRAVAELLRPIDALGPAKSRMMIDTLAAYLDAQGSLRETGHRLHLHPNAVSYRVRRIRELTSYDLDDVDTRFALHLACRIRRSGPAQ